MRVGFAAATAAGVGTGVGAALEAVGAGCAVGCTVDCAAAGLLSIDYFFISFYSIIFCALGQSGRFA